MRYNKEKVDKDEAEVLFWQKMLEPFDKHGRMDVDACMESFWPYLEANRRTTNTVFHASLNPSPEDRLTDDQLRDIAQEYMERMGYGNQPYIVFKHKDIEQVHIGIAFPSVKRYDEAYDATQIMNVILGGGVSSRLFQTVREELGLAYTVYSYVSTYAEAGALSVYAGVNTEKYLSSVDAIYRCIDDLRKKNISKEEFLRGKEQLVSSSIFSQESTSSQMLLFGKELLYSGRVYDFEDRIKQAERRHA